MKRRLASGTRRDTALALALVAATLAVYAPVLGHGFIDLDDRRYLLENPFVRGGLSVGGVARAFLGFDAGNWHPLTWISHQLDVELFGLTPAGHHATNLVLHATNAALLFWVLRVLTAQPLASAFAAALFALHPLHVESVAWVAERKDLLCALFGILAIGAYRGWVRRPSAARYTGVTLLLALGLLSKPMLVTLPVVLLLLDAWPLRRDAPLRQLVREKLAWLALAAVSCALTLAAQRSSAFVAPLEIYPVAARVANALVSYAAYLVQTLWPAGLAVYYPHPGSPPAWQVAGAALLLAGISALAVWRRRANPALLMGWLWYLGMLAPVIGVVQVGSQARADRYTYLPLVGIFVAVAFELPRALGALAPRAGAGLRGGTLAAALAVLVALGVASSLQLRHWKSGIALFERALAVGGESALVHRALGNSLYDEGRLGAALSHFEVSLRLDPADVETENALAATLFRLGRLEESAAHYRSVLARRPELAHVRYNLGLALARLGRADEAIEQLQQAAQDPAYTDAALRELLSLGK